MMHEKRELLKEILFSSWKDQHGKKRYLFILLGLLFGALSAFIVIYSREYLSHEAHQFFVFLFLLVVFLLTLVSLKYKK
jgi:hypothetical protein